MADRSLALTATRPGGWLARRLGLPRPVPLARHRVGAPVVDGPVVLGGPPAGDAGGDGRLVKPLRAALSSIGARVEDNPAEPPAALVFDATAITDSRD